MNEQIHGHEVMQMMVDSKTAYTKESLEKDIWKKFGKEARFFTCSAENMTAGELIEFLEKRGKFMNSEKGFSTDPSKICSHEGHHDHEHKD